MSFILRKEYKYNFTADGESMHTKKILLISHEMTYTGAPNSLLNMARLLRSKGWSVTVRTLETGNFSREFARHGFHVRWFEENLSVMDCRELASKYDLVICNTVFCAKIACRLQEFVKTILLIREAENLPEILTNCRIDECYIRNSENVICVSEYAKRFIAKTYSPRRLRVLHNFLLTQPAYRPPVNKVRGRKVHFLIAATVEKRKGIDIAIEAVKSLPESISEQLVLDIAGRKPEWSRSFWDGLIPINDARFKYHGEVTSGKKRLFGRTNVVLVPSLDEACSLTALEGGMFGKPLIVTENVGAKYMTDGSGFIVKTGDIGELATAIRFFVENQNCLDNAGKVCFKRFMQTSTEDVYYAEFIKIISDFCEAEQPFGAVNAYRKKSEEKDMSRKKRNQQIKTNTSKGKINIVLICDEGYAIPTVVTIQSIIFNSSKKYDYRIHVIASGVSEKYREVITNMAVSEENINITLIESTKELDEKISGLHKGNNMEFLVATETALLKFFLPSILDSCDKVLYLDGDLVVKTDLSDIYFTDIDDYYAAAVRDLPQVLFNEHLISAGENPQDYFNSGVMLLNLERLRNEHIEEKLVRTKLQQKDDSLMDQNVFNIVFSKKVMQLHFKYNVCYTNMVRSKSQYKYADLNRLYGSDYTSLNDIYNDAKILHFSSKMKPWIFWDSQLADEWLFYYKLSSVGNEELFRICKGDRITVDKEIAQQEIDLKIAKHMEMQQFEKVIPIVFATNKNYAPYAAVAISSVIAHANNNYYYDIYVLHDADFMLAQKNMLAGICGENYSVSCVDVRKGISSKDLYSRAHYSVQMYYRLLIPEILTQYDKVLYLDCDIVLNKDAAELFDTDIGDKIIGAVNNFVNNDMIKYLSETMKISPEKYINSGVLLMNCDKFILNNVKQKCFYQLNKHSELLCPDQDIINIVCSDRIKYLDDRWNFQWHHQWMNKFGEGAKLISAYQKRYNKIKNDFWLIHYTSGRKPWSYPELNFADIFWKYARTSDFYETILYRNVNDLVVKSLNSCLDKIISKPGSVKGDVYAKIIAEELSQKDKQINRLTGEVTEYRTTLIKTRASISFRIGQFLTFIPRKIRLFFNRKRS